MAVLMRIIIKITLNAGGTKLLLTYNGLALDSSLMGTFLKINHYEYNLNCALFNFFVLSQGSYKFCAL